MYTIKEPSKTQVGILEALKDEFRNDFNTSNIIAHVAIVPSNMVKQCIRNDYLG